MASLKSFFGKPIHIHPTNSDTPEDESLEFNEADIWNMSNSNTHQASGMGQTIVMEPKKALLSSSKSAFKRASPSYSRKQNQVASTSLPVKVPDWSKILQGEHGRKRREEDLDDHEDGIGDDEGIRIPPHEYLARRRGASFSVHEGIGRTLKGRDLHQVRNAIWKKVGFED